ncbi:hypothetical protein FA95DRAFT_865223 [Auriscalpium vulgare]|uniref:Uncharacterized protein n=1 Tax=Auriscalpium vulgare TaxID=40419 RepID=A0ACB8R983_9AGAM|nr:hypothetical protein FA95DRAFT_865223 [Auriscalpium vulgare]
MNSFNQPLWDFSQSADPTSFSQLADDDFLALLQKQFTPDLGAGNLGALSLPHDGIDPSKISTMPLPVPPPPLSEDSSPSPPNMNDVASSSRRQSRSFSAEGGDEQLKRKASDDDFEEGPSHKNPHLAKKNSTRRKSPGSQVWALEVFTTVSLSDVAGQRQDESRLLKRKEQNRAAQRAFRERKEKHVKDLEDKVAALEAKNETTETENTHLRELLKRLQDENVTLKQAQFTFSVPRQQAESNVASSSSFSSGSAFGSSSITPSPSATKNATPVSSSLDTPSSFPDIDFGSLTPFDSSSLTMLDDNGDTTMSYDFGYGQFIPSKTPYKTIASNPMFMSFADPSPADSPLSTNKSNAPTPGSAFEGTFGQWTGQTPRDPPTSSSGSIDELFGGHMFGAQSPVDFSVLMKSPASSSISPVNHATAPSTTSPASSSASPPVTQDSPGSSEHGKDGEGCPRTKAEMSQRIAESGSSVFAPSPPAPSTESNGASPVFKVSAENGPMIMCKGASFPPTHKSDSNVEVLSAWRSITSHPQFKASNIDINELCAEFTDKARCDGTKVVLDMEGVNHILEKLTAARNP